MYTARGASALNRQFIASTVCHTLLLFQFAIVLTAQAPTAAISGHVEDRSGGGVGGAMVKVRSLETGATREVTTDESGNYRLLSLGVGAQELTVEKAGFRAVKETGIRLAVGQ